MNEETFKKIVGMLTNEQLEELYNRTRLAPDLCYILITEMDKRKIYKTAQEKRIRELEEGLALMVIQFCSGHKKLQHKFMEAEENAFNLLGVKNGDTVESIYRKFCIEEEKGK